MFKKKYIDNDFWSDLSDSDLSEDMSDIDENEEDYEKTFQFPKQSMHPQLVTKLEHRSSSASSGFQSMCSSSASESDNNLEMNLSGRNC